MVMLNKINNVKIYVMKITKMYLVYVVIKIVNNVQNHKFVNNVKIIII